MGALQLRLGSNDTLLGRQAGGGLIDEIQINQQASMCVMPRGGREGGGRGGGGGGGGWEYFCL